MLGWFFHLTLPVKIGWSIFSGKESYSSELGILKFLTIDWKTLLKISDGIILSEDRTLLHIKTLPVKVYSCKKNKCK